MLRGHITDIDQVIGDYRDRNGHGAEAIPARQNSILEAVQKALGWDRAGGWNSVPVTEFTSLYLANTTTK